MMRPRIAPLAPALVMVSLCAPLRAQGGCNDTNNDLMQEGGTANAHSVNCPVLDLNGFQTPASCAESWRHTSANIYRCEGTLAGWHCNPKKYKIDVTVYSNGKCPELPDFTEMDPSSLVGIVNIAKVLVKSSYCIPPDKKTTTDDSADITECQTGSSGTSLWEVGQVLVDNGTFVATWATEAPTLQSESLVPFDPFTVWSGEAPPEVAGGVLHEVSAQAAGVAAVALAGVLEVRHWASGSPDPWSERKVTLTGTVAEDARFDLERAIPSEYRGTPISSLHRTTFDGGILLDWSPTSYAGSAHRLQPGFAGWIELQFLEEAKALHTWAFDPFDLEVSVHQDHVAVPTGPTSVRVERHLQRVDGSQYLSDTFELEQRGGSWLVTRVAAFDPAGTLWWERRCSDFFELRGGDWRPGTLEDTWYLQGDATGDRVQRTVRVSRATVVPASGLAGFPKGFDPDTRWYSWE